MQTISEPEVIANALLYVVNHTRSPDCHRVAKVLYLADKLHLERYGFPITGDKYIKMCYGPVPSVTYDAIKSLAGKSHSKHSETAQLVAKELSGALIVKGNSLEATREADVGELSQSMTDCLDEIIGQYDTLSFDTITDITHDAAWNKAAMHKEIPIESIVENLEGSEDILAYLRDPYGIGRTV